MDDLSDEEKDARRLSVLNGIALKESRDLMYGVAFKILKNVSDAEDARSQACIRAVRYSSNYNGKNLSGWLGRITRNVAFDFLIVRTKRREEPLYVDIVDRNRGPATITVENEEVERIWGEINGLPDKYKEVITGLAEGLNYREMGDYFEMPIGTIKTNICRGRKILTERLFALNN